MRLYQLVSELGNVFVHNEGTSHTMVLTPEGAVYDNADTSDVRNISIAFGLLITSDSWRLATSEEAQQLRDHPPVKMMELNWIIPPRPKLTLVDNYFDREKEESSMMVRTLNTEPSEEAKAFYDSLTREPAKVIYEKDGLKIYDDDDTQ